jgi:hypothetical protein
MAFTFVNSGSDYIAATATTIDAPATSLTSGNTIVVYARAGTHAVSGITDTAGNTYTEILDSFATTNNLTSGSLWYCANATGHASNVVTVTFASSAINRGVITAQYSTPATFSIVAKGAGAAASAQPSPVATITMTNALALFASTIDQTSVTWTAGTGMTKDAQSTNGALVICSRNVTTETEVPIGATANFTNQKNWGFVVFAEPAAEGGGGTTVVGDATTDFSNFLTNVIMSGRFRQGTGSPEGVITAGVGSIYLRADGGANTSIYVKESGTGNTGWVAK